MEPDKRKIALANLKDTTIFINPADISATIVLPEDSFSRQAILSSIQELGLKSDGIILDTGVLGSIKVDGFSKTAKALFLDHTEVQKLVDAGFDKPVFNAVRGKPPGRTYL